MFRFLCEHEFLFHLGKYLGVGLLGHKVTIGCILFFKHRKFFQSGWSILGSHRRCLGALPVLHLFQQLVLSDLFSYFLHPKEYRMVPS